MADKNNEVIGSEELSIYDALIKHYINLNYPKTNSNQIDDLFPVEPDPTEPVNPDPINPDPVEPDNPDPVQPAVLPNVSFGDATEEQFATIINGYYNGDFTLNQIQSIWHVGDTRSIDISAMSAEYVGESHAAQTITIRIIDFDHDELTTPINNKTKALLTVDLENCLAASGTVIGSTNSENGYMNSTAPITDGWKNCERRNWCNNIFYNSLPLYIKNSIKTVNKANFILGEYIVSPLGGAATVIVPDKTEVTEDKIFLLSAGEIITSENEEAADSAYIFRSILPIEGPTYNYYLDIRNREKGPAWVEEAKTSCYWLRTRYSNNEFYEIRYNNNFAHSTISNISGIAPAFCL